MKVEINVNEITNESIAKLTFIEIGNFGLSQAGINTYRGTLKSRVKGFKTTLRTDAQTNFESETARYEAIKIVATEDKDEYAIRYFNKEKNSYETFFPAIWGCEFFK